MIGKTSEIQKLFYNRTLVAVLLLFVLLHLIVCCYLYQDDQNGKYAFSPSGYRALQQEMRGMDNEEAALFLLNKQEILQEEGQTALQYEQSYYLEYLLLSEVSEEVKCCTDYKEQCEEIVKKSDSFMKTGILGGSSEYVARNSEQMQRDYSRMKKLSPVHGPAKGITLFSKNSITDFFVLALLLIMVVQLVCRERECKELLLYKTTFHGRGLLGVHKIMALFFISLFLVVIFYGSSLFCAGAFYGLGDVSRALQSVPYYSASVFLLSVRQFLMLYILLKWMAHFLIAMLFYFLALLCKNSGRFYVFVIIMLGIGVVFDTTIPDNSYFQMAKYINFYGALKSERLFRYINLSVLGVPVPAMTVVAIFMGIAMFVLIYLSVTIFYTQKEGAQEKKQARIFSRQGITEKSSSILIQECYKVLINGRMLLFLLSCAILLLVTCRPVKEEFYLNNDAYYKVYVKILKGPVTQKKLAYLTREQSRYDRIEKEHQKGELSDFSYSEQMKSYDAYKRIFEEKTPYLQSSGGYFIEEDAFLLLTGAKASGKKDIKLAFLAAFLVILPFSYLYGMEYQQGTDVFLHTYVCGGAYTAKRKLLLGVLLLTLVYLVVYLPFYITVFHTYGLAGLEAPACSLNHLYRIPASVTLWQYLLLVCLMRYLGLLLLLFFLCGISRYTKSFVGNLVVGMIGVILPLLLVYLEIPGMKYVLLNPLLIGNVFGISV